MFLNNSNSEIDFFNALILEITESNQDCLICVSKKIILLAKNYYKFTQEKFSKTLIFLNAFLIKDEYQYNTTLSESVKNKFIDCTT